MDRPAIQRVFAILAATILVSGMSFAAPAKKPAPKTTPKTSAPATNRATTGTTQLKSDYNNPKIGETFTLGKTSPINITVNSIEYTVDQVSIGSESHVAKANEKLMVIRYTLHNPNKSDFGLRWNTLKFTCVDANDKNWEYIQDTGIEGSGESCNMSLKPAQKTRLYAIIKVPAGVVVPKLMIEGSDRLVLRYNLQIKENKVKPLPAPIADPADATGATALAKVPAQLGAVYPIWYFDAKVDSIAFSDAPIKGKAPKDGHRYLVAISTIKNSCPVDRQVRWNSFLPQVVDQDGALLPWNGELLFGSRDDDVYTSVAPGQELRIRHYFEVPANLPLKSLMLSEGTDTRDYVYDITNLK